MSVLEVNFFFRDPSSTPEENQLLSRLYLLAGIQVCYGIDPNTQTQSLETQAYRPGAISILIGTDMLATCYAGKDGEGVGKRFIAFHASI